MKTFVPLENNPQVMTGLAHELGLSPSLAFHDVYSLNDPTLLSFVPRPVRALLVIIPMTPEWRARRTHEDEVSFKEEYQGYGKDEPVVWYKQTIGHACGLIGLLHCLSNGPRDSIITGSTMDRILEEALPLKTEQRAKVLYDSEALESAHQAAAQMGDSVAPIGEEFDQELHFLAFVKAKDGHLWELEGARKGPLERGFLAETEDALSEKALDLGIRKILKTEEAAGGDVRFSCIALGPNLD